MGKAPDTISREVAKSNRHELRSRLKNACWEVLGKRMPGPFFLFPDIDAEAPFKGGMDALFQREDFLRISAVF